MNIMMIPVSDVSLVAVVIATIACMGFGSLWYGPLFGERWMKLVGIRKDSMNKDDMKMAMMQGLVATLLSNFFIALLLLMAGTETVSGAIKLSIVLSFATGVPGALHDIAWERKPAGLFYLNASHHLVNFVLAAIIIQSLS